MTTTLDYAPAHTADSPTPDPALAALEAAGIPPAGVLVQLPYGWLLPDPGNERGAFQDDPKFQELVDSIRARGIREPLSAFQVGPQAYMIGSGHRRYAAAGVVGLAVLPAILRPAPADEVEQALDRLDANLHAPIDAIRRAQTYGVLLDAGRLTQGELAARAGCTQGTISKRLALLRLPEPVQQLIAAGQLTGEHGLALLGIKEPPLDYWGKEVRTVAEEQIQLAQEWARNAGSVDALRQRIDWNNDSRKQQVARLAEREAAALEQKARQATVQQQPVADPAVAAKQAELAAKAEREQAAQARHEDRLAERASWANDTIDRLLGWDPESAARGRMDRHLEVLRIAAVAAVEGASRSDYSYVGPISREERAALIAQIAAAPTVADLLPILATIGRRALGLDEERRALYHNDTTTWADTRWGLSVRIADALLAKKLIQSNSYKTLTAGKPQPTAPAPIPAIAALPARGEGARACPLCGAAMAVSGKHAGSWQCPACHTLAFLPMGLFLEHKSVPKPTAAALAAFAALPATGAAESAAPADAPTCPHCGGPLGPVCTGAGILAPDWGMCAACEKTVYLGAPAPAQAEPAV